MDPGETSGQEEVALAVEAVALVASEAEVSEVAALAEAGNQTH